MSLDDQRSRTTEELLRAAKQRGASIRRHHRLGVLAALAVVVAATVGTVAGFAGAADSHKVNVADQPTTSDTATTLPEPVTVTTPGTSPGATSTTVAAPSSGTSVSETTTTSAAQQYCTSDQVALTTTTDRSAYNWGDPITVTFTLSLIGTTPCIIGPGTHFGWHGYQCSPGFDVHDSAPAPGETPVGSFTACTTYAPAVQPFSLTPGALRVVSIPGALNCEDSVAYGCIRPAPDNPPGIAEPPAPGTRQWTVQAYWFWYQAQTLGGAQAGGNSNITITITTPQDSSPTTSTTTPPTTTTTTTAAATNSVAPH
jgi:hypothetical protein